MKRNVAVTVPETLESLIKAPMKLNKMVNVYKKQLR